MDGGSPSSRSRNEESRSALRHQLSRVPSRSGTRHRLAGAQAVAHDDTIVEGSSTGSSGQRWRHHLRRWTTRRLVVRSILALFASFGLAFLCLRLLSARRKPLEIPKRAWATQPYRHLNLSVHSTLQNGTRVLHVAKEFGPATMGGLGVMLTALSVAQAETPLLSVAAVIPHYSFLRDTYQATPFTRILVPITSRGHLRHVGCQISLLKWAYTPQTDFLDTPSPRDTPRIQREIDIYLIGPGDEAPFHIAFKAKDAGDVYSAYKPLKQEWKDLWFASAVSRFVEALKGSAPVDVIHLHGATNAMVAYYLQQIAAPPAVVYTLHDSLDEVEYSNLVSNALSFLPPSAPGSQVSPLSPLSPYIVGHQVFPSALGIDLSDMTTFVSRSIARDIVQGDFRFALQDLVMPSISKKASDGAFVGVTNGLDYTDQSKNPFVAEELLRLGISFPRVGRAALSSTHVSLPTISHSFSGSKDRAKRLLVSALPHLFSKDDLTRPLLLFIGRFQYNKGCEFFEPLLEFLTSSLPPVSGRLVVLGARNNYPIAALHSLVTRYPDHFTLIDDTTNLQRQYGSLIRLAADFAFVPSFSEAFGLVAAEGMLFGQQVISTGVGGLREFLRTAEDGHSTTGGRSPNAVTFNLYDSPIGDSVTDGDDSMLSFRADHARPSLEVLRPAMDRCRQAVGRALRNWQRMQSVPIERELFIRTLIDDALSLKWDREGGPIEEYTRVYEMALSHRRARSISDI